MADENRDKAAQDRAARLKAALRANLAKRKQHARDSAAGVRGEEETGPLPEG